MLLEVISADNKYQYTYAETKFLKRPMGCANPSPICADLSFIA